ncbi:MAG: DNA mismatch repair endonuclease MutL [Candidatus Symbiothrix sp.]|jgi:DNA mismatch repair protein MutL|nr:DNA mismatch repair endonuclease MutL [Candidatus Symbiothrix sp.]
MSDIIHLLSDSIANQIAAGEVIQRPASVVKELVENAVDAGAGIIQVIIKDAGRTLIQVIDNGKGMSETDARMAFERHATSKIKSAQDLFALQTMGFRGEALASIASVAQVELKTRRPDDELGTQIQLAGSQVERQEAAATAVGSSFAVKNLFFNVPARRKFLKSNDTEFKNILTEIERIALVNPEIAFSLQHNDTEVVTLPVSGLKQRISNLAGKKIAQSLVPVNVDTSLVKISGFIGLPETSKKQNPQQFFFVNGRYMQHFYFHRAVMLAYEPYIPAGDKPNYFIYLDIDPANIDVNIHPTKTEIKFENEPLLFQIITSAVKEAFATTPALNFDRAEVIGGDFPVFTGQHIPLEAPKVNYQSNYNPFKDTSIHGNSKTYDRPKIDWEQLYKTNKDDSHPALDAGSPPAFQGIADQVRNDNTDELFEQPVESRPFIQHGRYLITSLKSGLAIIDSRRAHIRILFDDYMRRMNQRKGVSQQLLFPEIITFTAKEVTVLPAILEDLAFIGFDLADLGGNSYSINGVPEGLENINIVETLQAMVDDVLENDGVGRNTVSPAHTESLALALAQKAALSHHKSIAEAEAMALIAGLFSSTSPNYTPDGKRILSILTEDELAKSVAS